jgi:mRNA interferase RelE/StbE
LLELRIYPDAIKFIASVGGKLAGQISIKIFELLRDPAPKDSEQLKGTSEGFRRADIGEFRIVYRVVENAREVPLVGRRNLDEVYRQLKRKGL